MNNYQTLKFPLLLFPVTAIYRWQIATECNCRWYICQCKAVAILEPSNLLLCSYISKRWTLPKASGIPEGPQDRIPGTRRMKDQSNLRPILQETLQTHSRTSWSLDPTWNPRNWTKLAMPYIKVLRHGCIKGQNQSFLRKKRLNLLDVFMTKTTSIYHKKVVFCRSYMVYGIKTSVSV